MNLPSIVKVEFKSTGAAQEVEIGFTPARVEIINKTSGLRLIATKGAANKDVLEAAAAISHPNTVVTYPTATKIKLATEATVLAADAECVLLAYRG